MDNLSQKARIEFDKLSQKLQEVIASDKKREPKLLESEKKEISDLEARILFLKPVNERLEKLLNEKDGRLKFLDTNIREMLIAGDDLNLLISEYVLLKPAIQILADTFNSTLFESSTDGSKIEDIKNKARERELREEAGNNE